MRTLVAVATLSLLAAFSLGASAQDKKPAQRSDSEKAAIAKVRQSGGQVLEIAQNDPRLDVAFHLADGDVKDEHLAPLKEMPSLAHLNLRGTKITDTGLAHLKDAKGLARLHLERTAVTDTGLEHLKALENLEYLNLYGTKVSDAGLKHLEGLKKLRKVYLWETPVTDAGAEQLKKALPDLTIIRGITLAQPAETKPEEPKKEEAKKE